MQWKLPEPAEGKEFFSQRLQEEFVESATVEVCAQATAGQPPS